MGSGPHRAAQHGRPAISGDGDFYVRRRVRDHRCVMSPLSRLAAGSPAYASSLLNTSTGPSTPRK